MQWARSSLHHTLQPGLPLAIAPDGFHPPKPIKNRYDFSETAQPGLRGGSGADEPIVRRLAMPQLTRTRMDAHPTLSLRGRGVTTIHKSRSTNHDPRSVFPVLTVARRLLTGGTPVPPAIHDPLSVFPVRSVASPLVDRRDTGPTTNHQSQVTNHYLSEATASGRG